MELKSFDEVKSPPMITRGTEVKLLEATSQPDSLKLNKPDKSINDIAMGWGKGGENFYSMRAGLCPMSHASERQGQDHKSQ